MAISSLFEVVPRAHPTRIVTEHKERVEKRPVGISQGVLDL
jgi:hypothetical protein